MSLLHVRWVFFDLGNTLISEKRAIDDRIGQIHRVFSGAAIFQLALKRAGCESRQAVMIGDRLDNDIRPAKRLGWRTIRVLQGFARVQVPRDADEEPDFTVGRLSEISSILV